MTLQKPTTHGPFLLPYAQRWTPEQIEECRNLWDLSEDDTSKLVELGDRVSDLSHSAWNGPFQLVRFVLDASCHGNMKTMEKRVRQCVEWRDQHGMDTLLETHAPPRRILEFPFGILQGLDKNGDLVNVVRSGAGDPLSLLRRYGREELIDMVFWALEYVTRGPWLRDHAEKMPAGRPKQVTAILDLKGLNRRQYHPSLMLLAPRVLGPIQLHYPHQAKRAIIINTPAIFRFVFSLLKPFLMDTTMDLLEVVSEADTERVLRKYVDLEILPEILAPGKGQGKTVPGFYPIWEGGIFAPSDKDWERIPLVYGPDNSDKFTESSSSSQATVSTSRSSSSSWSTCSNSTVAEESNNNNNSQPSAKSLLKGCWTDDDQRETGTIRVRCRYVL